MTDVRVTVGIPTFNRAGWLKAAIESVLTQTFTSFRLIVSDNASDDDTPDVVQSFTDERIRYVRSERNVGGIGNFNRLIALAETEFLVLLPDDDMLYPGYLEAAVEVLERYETVGLVHSAFDLLDARSRVIEDGVQPMRSRSAVTIEKRELALERLMVSGWALCFSSVAYRTKAIVDAGGLREKEEPFGDRQLWMRLALDWDFGYIAKPLVGFRTHPDTISMRVAGRLGVTSDGPARGLLNSEIHFQRRMDFLDGASLDPGKTKRLRALATLKLLADSAKLGLSSHKVATRLASLVRGYPRILLRPALWRLVVAQLGGRRVRSALRGSSIRYRHILHG